MCRFLTKHIYRLNAIETPIPAGFFCGTLWAGSWMYLRNERNWNRYVRVGPAPAFTCGDSEEPSGFRAPCGVGGGGRGEGAVWQLPMPQPASSLPYRVSIGTKPQCILFTCKSHLRVHFQGNPSNSVSFWMSFYPWKGWLFKGWLDHKINWVCVPDQCDTENVSLCQLRNIIYELSPGSWRTL